MNDSNDTSSLHPCYLGVVFPEFVRPVHSNGFNGTKMMAQGTGINKKLMGLPTYSYTRYCPRENLYWMKLSKSSDDFAVVPVRAEADLPKDLWVSNSLFERRLEAMNKGEY